MQSALVEHSDAASKGASIVAQEPSARNASISRLLPGFGEERGKWWMALELIEGADLGAILPGGTRVGYHASDRRRALRRRRDRAPVSKVIAITQPCRGVDARRSFPS